VIKAALAIGKKNLNQYYNKTDYSKVFRIAMGMHFLTLPPFFILSTASITLSQASIFQKCRMAG
jgi:hypothetical protein